MEESCKYTLGHMMECDSTKCQLFAIDLTTMLTGVQGRSFEEEMETLSTVASIVGENGVVKGRLPVTDTTRDVDHQISQDPS